MNRHLETGEYVMSSCGRVKTIGVFGHVGNSNLGDEAIITSVIANIRERLPTAVIRGFTLRPADTHERHKIAAFPLRRLRIARPTVTSQEAERRRSIRSFASVEWFVKVKEALKKFPRLRRSLAGAQRGLLILLSAMGEPSFLVKSYVNMRGVDLLLIAGSSQLIDYVPGGAWGHPYTIFKWVLIARFQRTKVAFVSCGAGPIQSRLGRLFIRASLTMAEYISFRDESSRACVEQLGVSKRRPVCPDLAFALRIPEANNHEPPSSSRPIIGINAIPFSDPRMWIGGGVVAYETYIKALARVAEWVVARGYAVMFFPTQLRADPPAISDLLCLTTRLIDPELKRHVFERRIKSFDDLVASLRSAEMVIATRFHGIVISYLLNKPVLGIAYAAKTRDLMMQMGQGEFALDIFQLDLERIQERFVQLETRQPELKVEISQRVTRHYQVLASQYDEVLALIHTVDV